MSCPEGDPKNTMYVYLLFTKKIPFLLHLLGTRRFSRAIETFLTSLFQFCTLNCCVSVFLSVTSMTVSYLPYLLHFTFFVVWAKVFVFLQLSQS